ncbi:MAG TPA: hypothetical protein VGB85_16010 [Nannocystis sp.]
MVRSTGVAARAGMCAVLVTAFASACAEEEPTSFCSEDTAVQLFRDRRLDDLSTWTSGGLHFLGVLDVARINEKFLYLVERCDTPPLLIASGAHAVLPLFHVEDVPPRSACLYDWSDGPYLVELDVTGERAPRRILDGFKCQAAQAASGVVLHKDGTWLFPDFPDLGSARRILGVDAWPTDPGADALRYQTATGELHWFDISDATDTVVLSDVEAWWGRGDQIFWRSSRPEDAEWVNLYDHRRRKSVRLGMYRPEDSAGPPYVAGQLSWRMNPPRTHALHIPFRAPDELEIFDLDGQPAPLPFTKPPFLWAPDGLVFAPGDLESEVQYARPGDLAARRLVYPPGASNQYGGLHGTNIEVFAGNSLWAVPLDGSPFREIARGVGRVEWLDDTHILTTFGGALITIDVATGARTVHAKDIYSLRPAGDGGYYFEIVARDPVTPDDPRVGIWYLSATAALAPPGCEGLLGCPSRK